MKFKNIIISFSKYGIMAFIMCLLFLSCGCSQKEVDNALIFRDSSMTGGNITFSYDRQNGKIYFGGEGETIQFYEKDISKGWNDDGCRIGLSIISPISIDDVDGIEIKLDGKVVKENNLFSIVNDDEIPQINLFPIVSQEKKNLTLEIKWSSSTKTQNYEIIILEGTNFMQN